MSQLYHADGSIDLVDDADRGRTRTIVAGTTPADRDAAIAAFFGSPKPLTQMGFLAFMTLFTSAEQAAFVGSSDTQVALFRLMAAGAGEIDLADQRTIQGVKSLVSAKLLSADRAAAVLAGTAAP